MPEQLFIRKGLLKTALVFCCLFFISIFSCKQKQAPTASEPPEENRFTKVVLTEGMDEPMMMSFLNDGRILIIVRKGALKMFNTKTNEINLITTIPVNTKYVSKEGVSSEAEEGLMGIIADPKFAENHWIYLYYSDPGIPKFVVARWELQGDSLYSATKKIILEIPTQRETCCHTGGGMAFDKDGNLYLAVGNNTANPESGTASYDERAGRSSWDDQRGSGNTNDLRGKILRILPGENGSYTIPEGNLFPKGSSKTRPEIYIMGDRNPWRVSIDSKTGWLYWGEVGPDASVDSVYGSRGYDEFNQARKAGFFGWPYFIGDNKAYVKYNYADSTYGEKFNPEHPVNNSPNNSGLRELPPAHKAFIWYPYGISDSFPLVGSSGRSAVGGPIFHKTDFTKAARVWPDYFEDKWIITDFMRGWIMAVTMNKNGDYQSMEQILPKENFSSVIDMKFGPEGDLYVLEYGSAWFRGNANSALIRIEYNQGNRKPSVEASANRIAGSIPFQVALSSSGTLDYDKYDQDALKFEWDISSSNGYHETFTDPNPKLILDQAGTYEAKLTVTDTRGEKNSKTLELKAGNDPPVVNINILKGNKTFFFPNQSIQYAIEISDKEDGTVASGKVSPDEIAVNFDYIPDGFDPIEIARHHRAADAKTGFIAGLYLMNASDCKTCHLPDKNSVGPSFLNIAGKYKSDQGAVARLAAKVIQGGGGVWGEHAMSAHPKISQPEAETIVKYILSMGQKQIPLPMIPLSGNYTPRIPKGDNGKGGYLLSAAYSDKGNGNIGSLSSEYLLPLRSPSLVPERADIQAHTQLLTTPSVSFSMLGDHSYLGYNNIDFSGIRQIEFWVQATPNEGDAGGIIEVHLDAPDGRLIGQTEMVVSKAFDFDSMMKKLGGQDKKASVAGKKKDGDKKASNQPKEFDFSLLRKLMATKAMAPISAEEGIHKVFFVFRNPKAEANQPLMQMVEIQFQNKVPEVAAK